MSPGALLVLGLGVVALLLARDALGSTPGALGVTSGLQGAGDSLLAAWGRVSGAPYVAPTRAAPYTAAIAGAEDAHGIPANLLLRQLDIESDHFDPDVIDGVRVSRTGAIGIAQLEPATAAELGVDPRDAYASIDAAARMMARLYRKFGSWKLALAAYNWGEGHVARQGFGAAPAETVDYVDRIISAVPGVA